MSVFTLVKDSVDIVDAAERYGITVNRYKKARCPFHDDRNPSLSFKDQRFKCFVCEARGDVIDLIGHLANTPPLETVRELNQSYNLGIDIDKPIPSAEIRRRKHIQEQKKVFAEWITDTGWTLAHYVRMLGDWQETYAPENPDDELHPRFVQALREKEYIEYILESVFRSDDLGEKKAFYLQYSHRVEQIAQLLSEERDARAGGTKADGYSSGSAFPFELDPAGYSQAAA